MLTTRSAAPALLPLLLTACASQGQTPSGEEQPPLKRAEAHLAANEYAEARADLLEHLSDEPDDSQARYVLARALSYLGELRAARAELERVVAEDPESPLPWDLLGAVHEQLGDHREALAAYDQVQRRSDSIAPLLSIARCQLYLGQPEAVLVTVEAARQRRDKEPWCDFFAYQALRRMGRPREAVDAARNYLELAKDKPEHEVYLQRVKSWLETQRASLEANVRDVIADYVRAACRLRMPGANAPEEAILASAPERLFAYDDRPVFLTLYPPGATQRFTGHGRGDSLAAALKGAVEALTENPDYAPIKVRRAALRIDVGQDLEPVELREGPRGLVADPPVQLGRHGLALRADGREVFSLPGDPMSEDRARLDDLLSFASQRAGLGPDAWRASTGAVFRFEAESFLSAAPGVSPASLAFSEPTPGPEATPRAIAEALRTGAAWLTSLLQPEGGLAGGYSPTRASLDASGDQVLLASPETSLDAALVLARLHGRTQSPQWLAAKNHLLSRHLAGEAPLSERAGATLVRALLPAREDDPPGAAQRRAELLRACSGSAGASALRARLAGGEDAAAVAAARAGELGGGEEVALLLDLAFAGHEPARATALEWASAQLSAAPPASSGARARWLESLARAARLARDQGHSDAARLRAAVRAQARSLLALQLGERHRYLCREPGQALGAFRSALGKVHVRPETTIAALAALVACEDLLGS
jgi:tetratricopeptide (TPR) repeat protein